MHKDSRVDSVHVYRLCLDEFDETRFSGSVYSLTSSMPLMFRNLDEFVVKMDEYLDMLGSPQSFQNKRSLRKKEGNISSFRSNIECVQTYEDIANYVGRHKTYDVFIESRRNTNWQGSILNEDDETIPFSDVIELINLL